MNHPTGEGGPVPALVLSVAGGLDWRLGVEGKYREVNK